MKFKSTCLYLAALSFSLIGCNSVNSENTEVNDPTPSETEVKVNKDNFLPENQIQQSNSTTQEVASYEVKSNIRFICANGPDRSENGKNLNFPTTYAWTAKGPIPIVRWQFAWFQSEEWDIQSRCDAVSSRFQEAYNNQSMLYFTYGKQNNQNIICTAYEEGGDCVTMLFTIRPNEDPVEITRDLTGILNGKGTGPVENSSGEKKVYFKITNINKFLEFAPVEKK